MKYHVKVTESYSYTKEVECENESELQKILHDEVPLLVDMSHAEIEHIRKQGLELKSDFEWN